MAQQEGGGAGSVLKWGLLAGAAWFLYENFKGSAAPVAASSPAGSVSLTDLASSSGAAATPAATAPAVNPSALIAQLQAAAAPDANLVNGQMSAWQWNYYLNILRPPGVPGPQFAAAFPDAAQLITAAQFVGALGGQAGGLSGLGSVTIPVPVMVQSGGRPVVVWAARELPGSGAKNEMRVALFPGAHPFGVRPRGLPALQRVAKG